MNNRLITPLCIVLMLALSMVAYSLLPQRVPIHWNVQGEVDGYGSREIAALMLPVIAVAVALLLRVLPLKDPVSNAAANASVFHRYGNWIVIFLLILHAGMLGNALGFQFDFVQLIMIALGLLLVVIGNEMGRLKPNSWAGIRLPWTLTNERVWRESNRVGGRLFVVAGLIVALTTALLPQTLMFIAAIAVLMVATIVIGVYSFAIARRHSHTGIE